MATVLKFGFWLCSLIWLASCWNYDRFLEPVSLHPAVNEEPVQDSTLRTPFEVTSSGVTYRIQPLHDYALHGLVVSLRHHDGNFMLHRLWNDHLNVADICVIWGRNARELKLNQYEFWNAEFTCYVQAPTRESWLAFGMNQLSNNHLLTERANIRAAIQNVEVGDQIHLTGYLAEYANDSGFYRGTSTVRDDSGNGACETIYLQSFAIIRPMETLWRTLHGPAAFGSLACAFLWLLGVARGRF